MLVAISGISGSGKSTLGEALALQLGWNYLDQDLFFRRDKPLVELSTGEKVKNWDSLKAINCDEMREAIIKFMSAGSLILTGFALWDELLPVKPKYHFHLSTGDIPSEIIKRCISAREKSKGLSKRDQLMVAEVVYPFYVQTLENSSITDKISVYERDGKRKSVQQLLDILSSKMIA